MNRDELIKAIQKETGYFPTDIDKVLESFGQIMTEEVTNGYEVDINAYGDLPIPSTDPSRIDLSQIYISKKVLALVPEHIARHYQVVPVEIKNDNLILAMTNPDDQEALEFVSNKTGKNLLVKICTQTEFNRILGQYEDLKIT